MEGGKSKLKNRRDRRMTDNSEEDSYEEEPATLESQMKAALKILGRNTSPGVDAILIKLFQSHRD